MDFQISFRAMFALRFVGFVNNACYKLYQYNHTVARFNGLIHQHCRQSGITTEERAVLSAHVPESHQLRDENLEEIAKRKEEYFFKPLHGFAGHGVLSASQVGLGRLKRLLRKKQGYLAQKRIPKPILTGSGIGGSIPLWTDLRVWAYRGQRYLISARASRKPDFLDLSPPGGWLPTYVGDSGKASASVFRWIEDF